MLYRRNRYYDPLAGQFTQEDPIGLAGGINLYGFANGDPINLSDPFGLMPCEDLPGTEAPCELFFAVFSEASPDDPLEQRAIAFAIINRALASNEFPFGGVLNTGDLMTDVAAQASTGDIQGTGNSQFALIKNAVEGGTLGDLNPLSLEQFASVLLQTELAFRGLVEDPTNGGTFFDANNSGKPSSFCTTEQTATVGVFAFHRCVGGN